MPNAWNIITADTMIMDTMVVMVATVPAAIVRPARVPAARTVMAPAVPRAVEGNLPPVSAFILRSA